MHVKWVPVRVTLDPRGSEVQWMNCAGVSFQAPFFEQTILQCQATREQFVSDLAHDPEIDVGSILQPALFIFHMSRCGSTLVANSLRALDRAIVISEAQPVNAALAASDEALLRRMMRYLAQPLKGCEQRLFFKFTSWNIARLPLLRSLFPETPAIFLVRDPVEVIVSNLAGAAGWMEMKNQPEQVRALYGWRDVDSRQMSREEFCARVLGHFCWVAHHARRARDVVLDYRDLTPAAMRALLESIGLAATAAELDRIGAGFAVDAKDPLGTRVFQGDSADKRRRATGQHIDAADRWAYPAYRRLLKSPQRL